ncbi:hypothetical protein KXD97_13580 [Mycobacterium sp. SMC-8]|uniref:hypothetical protein n=1 Tax=Mycobacterium sp. SMC-8 TaxID=2857060 RepID=UPI0021B40273|nr:hypothetical protein [Mycobacterium sp. SMC-8]UXA14702.1 hypothetical protein KXD97_13580 [Mycobacterium sp. SMC-8]
MTVDRDHVEHLDDHELEAAVRRTTIFARISPTQSRPSPALVVATASAIVVGVALTISPLGPHLGFTPLPWQFFAALAALTLAYLVLVDVTKTMFYGEPVHVADEPLRTRGRAHRVHRRAARFSHPARTNGPRPVPRGSLT